MDKTPSFLDSVVNYNVLSQFRYLLQQGWYIHPDTKLITPGQLSIDWTRNWIFTNPDPHRSCDLYQNIFKTLGFVPTPCVNCWKVVVKIPSVHALIGVYQFQKEFTKECFRKDRFCKCGIEEREWVTYQYGAYFYCDSLEQGIERHKEVVAGLQDVFGKSAVKTTPGAEKKGKVEVILKRYCTEFELKLGPTDQYEQPPGAEIWEEKINAAFDVSKINSIQPDYLIQDILERWLRFAYDRGDPTAVEFNNGEPFYTPVVTYHDKEQTK